MKGYKLTNLDQTTKNKTRFEVGVPVYVKGMSPYLCSDGWIHFYVNPIIAVLMNPAHANFDPFLMWECKTGGKEKHQSLKSGCKVLTITKQVEPPTITLESKIAFGILCAMEVYDGLSWTQWAQAWLSGEDRTLESANDAAADSYAYSYDDAYVYAASANVYAAYAAAHIHASNANIYVANAAAHAVGYANSAANAHIAAHAYAAKHIDFVALAEKALTIS